MAFLERFRQRGLSNVAVGSVCGRENAQAGVPYAPYIPPDATSKATAVSVTSINVSGQTATVVATSHGLSVGDTALIQGANQFQYNGNQRVLTAADANTFTFTVNGSPTTPATGTITSTKVGPTIFGDANG